MSMEQLIMVVSVVLGNAVTVGIPVVVLLLKTERRITRNETILEGVCNHINKCPQSSVNPIL